GGRAAEPRFHLREHGTDSESAAHTRYDHDVHDAARRSDIAALDAGPIRYVGPARAARAGVSAHELRKLPSHRRAHAKLNGSALFHAALEHERVRRLAA